MTRFLLLLLLNWEAGFSSSRCPHGSFLCQEGGQVPQCLGYERQPGCQDDPSGCQQPRSTCRGHACRCGNSSGPCLPFERFCDQHRDCPDGSDEGGSLCAVPGGGCESEEFRCRPGAECFPLSFKCDGHPDCEDGADEEGCGTEWPEAPRTPPVTPKGGRSPPETLILDPLTIAAIVALLVTVMAAAGISLWLSRKAKPLRAHVPLKAAFEQLIPVGHP